MAEHVTLLEVLTVSVLCTSLSRLLAGRYQAQRPFCLVHGLRQQEPVWKSFFHCPLSGLKLRLSSLSALSQHIIML
jgi:hypothetical protein